MPSTFVNLTYHIVFSTKNREPMIASTWRPRLYEFFGGCVRTSGGTCLEIGGTADHLHLLAGLKATHRMSDFLRDVKRATSSWARDTVLPTFAWQDGYGAFSVSQGVCPKVVQYIRRQEEHHRTQTFQEEYRELLRRAGITFDERYLW
ncbi:MAG: transposase [Thermoanaerobaculia bacterium]